MKNTIAKSKDFVFVFISPPYALLFAQQNGHSRTNSYPCNRNRRNADTASAAALRGCRFRVFCPFCIYGNRSLRSDSYFADRFGKIRIGIPTVKFISDTRRSLQLEALRRQIRRCIGRRILSPVQHIFDLPFTGIFSALSATHFAYKVMLPVLPAAISVTRSVHASSAYQPAKIYPSRTASFKTIAF